MRGTLKMEHKMRYEKRKNLRFVFLATVVACAALAITLTTFSQETAQTSKTAVSDAELDAALRRALPGAVTAHGGIGPGGTQGGHQGMGPAARAVMMSDIPQKTHATELSEGAHADRPLSGLTDEQYDALKRRVAQRLAAGEIGAKPSPVAAKVGPKMVSGMIPLGVTRGPNSVSRGPGWFGQKEAGLDPPDMSLAVSENYVLQMVNSDLAVYDKFGNLQAGFPKDVATFMGHPGVFMFDPRAFYDWANRRFFILMDTWTTVNGVNVGGLTWAASQTPDPTGGWWVYYNFTGFPLGSGVCGDFPTLGHDTTNWGTYATKGGIYIGVNVWSTPSSCTPGVYSFTSNGVFFIPKDAIYAGAGFGYWEFNGINVNGTVVDTLQPYNVTDRADKPSSIFLLNSYNYDWGGGVCSNGCNDLDLWAVSGPTTAKGSVSAAPNNPFQFLQGGNGPIITLKGVATTHTYSTPPYAYSKNCPSTSGSPCIDRDYTFISGQVKYHAGELFGSLNTGVSGTSPAVAGPLWFEVHPETDNNGQLTAAQNHSEDCFVCGGWPSNGSAYYATLQPDQENNVVMVFAYSTDADYPGAVYTSRRATYGDSLMDGRGIFLEPGQNAVSGRWGDYSATSPDFTNPTRGLLWFSIVYAPTSGSWGTVVGAAQYNTATDQ
jgi:hypothetical protein